MRLKSTLFSLLISVCFLLAPAVGRAAGTGQAAVSISVEIKGQTKIVSGATVTLMDREIDLDAVDLIARQKSGYRNGSGKSAPDPTECNYWRSRFNYLVKYIEDSRRNGVSEIKHGVATKRTDGSGNVIFRYLQPGTYYLGAYRKMGQAGAIWSVPIQVSPDKTTEVELNNANVFELYYPGK